MRQMLEGRVLSWFHCAFGHWHVPACWWQPEYYSPLVVVKTSVMTSIKFLRDPATGLPTDAFDAGSTTASSFAGERVGIVVNVFSIAFTVIGRWYEMYATGGRRFVCRVPASRMRLLHPWPGKSLKAVRPRWGQKQCARWKTLVKLPLIHKFLHHLGGYLWSILHIFTLLCHQIVQDFVHRPDPPLQALLEDLDEDDEEFEEACSA